MDTGQDLERVDTSHHLWATVCALLRYKNGKNQKEAFGPMNSDQHTIQHVILPAGSAMLLHLQPALAQLHTLRHATLVSL